MADRPSVRGAAFTSTDADVIAAIEARFSVTRALVQEAVSWARERGFDGGLVLHNNRSHLALAAVIGPAQPRKGWVFQPGVMVGDGAAAFAPATTSADFARMVSLSVALPRVPGVPRTYRDVDASGKRLLTKTPMLFIHEGVAYCLADAPLRVTRAMARERAAWQPCNLADAKAAYAAWAAVSREA